mgnify:CR=1 FL=1
MKCTPCHSKHVVWGLGFCKKCGGTTQSSMYKCCDKCAQQLQQCQVCGVGMGAGSTSTPTQPGPSVYIIKVDAKDNGQTITGVRTGEHIEIMLDEDQYAGKEWGIKNVPSAFAKQHNGEFTQNPQNPQYGVRTFLFDCQRAGIEDIELHEVQRSYSYGWGGGGGYTPVPGGKTFKVTIEIN